MNNGDGSAIEANMADLMPAGQKAKSQGRDTKAQAAPPVKSGAQPTTAKQGRKPASPTDTPAYPEETENAPTNDDSTETAKSDSVNMPHLRVNHSPHPGTIDKGQTHQTKAQIAQECQHIKENKCHLEELEAEKKCCWLKCWELLMKLRGMRKEPS